MKIDAHQHFWIYDANSYDWITEDMGCIRRAFLPKDLAPLAEAEGIVGTMAVQARQSLQETDWLLELAEARPDVIKGVVGWVPLHDRGEWIGEVLDQYTGASFFKGVRHVLQGEEDEYMAGKAFNEALKRVGERGLSYDLLILGRQLPSARMLVDRHPGLPFVLDHIAKPEIAGAPPPEWVRGIRELAERSHVFCKFSGVVTEVRGGKWTPELLRPYFDVVLEAFGTERVMFGSDWPVCQVAATYQEWHGFVEDCVASLSSDEQHAVLGYNAVRFYRLT